MSTSHSAIWSRMRSSRVPCGCQATSRWAWQANSSRIRTSEIAARLDLFLTRGLHGQQLNRNAKPLRGFFAILEHADFDWRTLSQYGMQLAVMNSCSIGSENR